MDWKNAEGHPPPPSGDARKLVWLEDHDGMCWIGIRAYRHDQGYWTVNGDREESAVVRFWMDLPDPPNISGGQ